MRWLILLLVLLLAGLQGRLWIGEGSFADLWNLKHSVARQEQENIALQERNQALEAEVKDLRTGLDAIEQRARSELGMIKKGEVFYQIVEQPGNSPGRDD